MLEHVEIVDILTVCSLDQVYSMWSFKNCVMYFKSKGNNDSTTVTMSYCIYTVYGHCKHLHIIKNYE